MEYYSEYFKEKEMIPFSTAGMDLESIMQSEIIQTEKDKYHMISLTCGIKKTENNSNGTNIFRKQISGYQKQVIEGQAKWVKVVKRYKHPVIK